MAALTQTTRQFQSIGDTPADWSQTLDFAQFDPSLGALAGIDVGLTADVTGNVAITSLEAAPAITTAWLTSVVAVSSPTGVLLTATEADAANSATLAASGGTAMLSLSGMGTSNTNWQPGSIDLGDFVGVSTVPLTVADTTVVDVAGPANMMITAHASTGAVVSLQYDYEPGGQNSGGGSDGGSTLATVVPIKLLPLAALTSSTQTFTYADATTGWSNQAAITQFNPELGTLEAVNLTITADIQASVNFLNEDSEAASFDTGQTADVSFGSWISASPSVTDYVTVASDANYSESGISGTDSASAQLTDPADLSAFIGQGTVSVPVSAPGTGSVDGPGNFLATLLAQAGATVTVSYTYLPTGVAADAGTWGSVGPDWNDIGSGDWTSSSYWQGTSGPIPATTDDVAIDTPGTYTITVNTAQTIHSIVIDDPGATVLLDANLTTTGDVILDAGTIDFEGGTLSVNNLTVNGGVITGTTMDVHAAGSIDINAGSIVATDMVLSAAGPVIQTATLSVGGGSTAPWMGGSAHWGQSEEMQFTSHADVLSGAYQVLGSGGTIAAGSLRDLISFANGFAGGASTIQDFLPGQDHIGLSGYGLGVVATVLQSAVPAPGGTTVTLPDGTSITVAGIDHLRAADFITN